MPRIGRAVMIAAALAFSSAAFAQSTTPPKPAHKIPVLAWGLSFIPFTLCAGGQLYNAQYIKAIGFAAACVGANVILSYDDSSPLGGLLFLGSWMVSWIDAPLSAHAINVRRDGLTAGGENSGPAEWRTEGPWQGQTSMSVERTQRRMVRVPILRLTF